MLDKIRYSAKFTVFSLSFLFSACAHVNGDQTALDPNQIVYEASITDLRSALKSKSFSCEQIVSAYLKRIQSFDKSTGLNAITVINQNAVTEARAADAKFHPEIFDDQPLFCIPVLIKDNIDTVGYETTGGSSALLGKPVLQNATLYSKLMDAGAIMIAKTNMAEWAFSPRQTISGSFGRTANAYDLDFTPAGSSGGTASGIAASFATIGIGTDTGNSVRGPSSHLSLVGLRPTLGLVSRAGIVPLAFDRDTAGPMTKTAADAAIVMSVISGSDPRDEYTKVERDLDFVEALDSAKLDDLRIGVLLDMVNREKDDPDVIQAFDRAISDLSDAGAVVKNVTIENFETLANDESLFCARFGYDLRQYLKNRGLDNDSSLTLASLRRNKTYGADEQVPSGLDYFIKYSSDVHPKDWETPCPDLDDHPARNAFRQSIIKALDDGAYDAFIYPSWAQLPAPIETAHKDHAGDNNQIISPATGLPAVTVPMGFSATGLPMGLQFLGRAYSDAVLLGIANAYETNTHHRKPPAQYPPLQDKATETEK